MTTTRIIILAALVFIFDQASKWWVLYGLNLPQIGAMEIIPGFVNFIIAWNKGINFGLLASDSIITQSILIAAPILVSAGVLWWNYKSPSRFLGLGSAFIIGGALANGLDRIIHGAVVDFLNVTAFGYHNPFSFNIADVAIFLGAALIMVDLWGDDQAEKNRQKNTDSHPN